MGGHSLSPFESKDLQGVSELHRPEEDQHSFEKEGLTRKLTGSFRLSIVRADC